jgi:photosystem II stability/assembly factor-like uncharacterized protein
MFKSSILCASILCASGMVMAATTSPPGPPGITPPGPTGPPPGPQLSITPPGPPGPIILPGPQALFCPKGGTWKQIGPAPLTVAGRPNESGQVLDIAIDPRGSSDSTIYVATNGGIWKTTDGGSSWDTRTDCLANVRMGAVALDAGNPSVVYAGTGNFFSNGGVNQPIPAIVYKSYDAGWSWWPLSLPSGSTDTIRMVSPAVNQLLVGTDNGLFRATDGGGNFHSVLSGSITDLKVDTANSSTIYAAVAQKGIFQSNDGGETFRKNLFNNPGAPSPANTGRILLSQSTQPNSQTIYASVERGGGYLGLYKSIDTGSSWVPVPYTAADRGCSDNKGQDTGCAYSTTHTIGVDPKNPDRVYLGFTRLSALVDGTWRIGNNVHDDFHALVFSPPSHVTGFSLLFPPTHTDFYAGTDGGIAKTSDGLNFTGVNGTAPHGIATNLFGPPIDIGRRSVTNNQFIYGGMQDTGTGVHRPDLPPLEWDMTHGGDGDQVAVDPTNPKKAYAARGGQYMTTVDGGKTPWITPLPGSTGLPSCCDPVGSVGRPILVDPDDSNNVYVVDSPDHKKLFQSRDGGKTFTLINTFKSGVEASSPSMVPNANYIMWVALDSGKVAVNQNILTTPSIWTELDVPDPDTRVAAPATAVAIDPTDTRRVVVVYGGFSKIDALLLPTKHVFMTTDGGSNWRDISGDLPDRPLMAVVINKNTRPHAIVVAGLGGVFESLNEGESWHVLGTGFPNVLVMSLALDTSVDPSLLVAATWGRSVFSMNLENPPPPRPPPPGRVDNGCGKPAVPLPGGLGNGVKGSPCEFRDSSGRHVFDGILVCGVGGSLICCPIGSTTGPGCGPGAPPLPGPGSPQTQ